MPHPIRPQSDLFLFGRAPIEADLPTPAFNVVIDERGNPADNSSLWRQMVGRINTFQRPRLFPRLFDDTPVTVRRHRRDHYNGLGGIAAMAAAVFVTINGTQTLISLPRYGQLTYSEDSTRLDAEIEGARRARLNNFNRANEGTLNLAINECIEAIKNTTRNLAQRTGNLRALLDYYDSLPETSPRREALRQRLVALDLSRLPLADRTERSERPVEGTPLSPPPFLRSTQLRSFLDLAYMGNETAHKRLGEFNFGSFAEEMYYYHNEYGLEMTPRPGSLENATLIMAAARLGIQGAREEMEELDVAGLRGQGENLPDQTRMRMELAHYQVIHGLYSAGRHDDADPSEINDIRDLIRGAELGIDSFSMEGWNPEVLGTMAEAGNRDAAEVLEVRYGARAHRTLRENATRIIEAARISGTEPSPDAFEGIFEGLVQALGRNEYARFFTQAERLQVIVDAAFATGETPLSTHLRGLGFSPTPAVRNLEDLMGHDYTGTHAERGYSEVTPTYEANNISYTIPERGRVLVSDQIERVSAISGSEAMRLVRYFQNHPGGEGTLNQRMLNLRRLTQAYVERVDPASRDLIGQTLMNIQLEPEIAQALNAAGISTYGAIPDHDREAYISTIIDLATLGHRTALGIVREIQLTHEDAVPTYSDGSLRYHNDVRAIAFNLYRLHLAASLDNSSARDILITTRFPDSLLPVMSEIYPYGFERRTIVRATLYAATRGNTSAQEVLQRSLASNDLRAMNEAELTYAAELLHRDATNRSQWQRVIDNEVTLRQRETPTPSEERFTALRNAITQARNAAVETRPIEGAPASPGPHAATPSQPSAPTTGTSDTRGPGSRGSSEIRPARIGTEPVDVFDDILPDPFSDPFDPMGRFGGRR